MGSRRVQARGGGRRASRRLLGWLAVLWIGLGHLTGLPVLLAQSSNGPFTRYGVEEGLTSPSVTALLQDRHGFVWVGTEDGLNRFDGARFLPFRSHTNDSLTLAESYVTALAEDGDGSLWIGSRRMGLSRLELATRRVTRLPFMTADTTRSLKGNAVEAMVRSGDTLWITLGDAGLSRLDLSTGRYTHYDLHAMQRPELRGNDASALLKDRQGELWIGTWERGLLRFDPRTGRSTHYVYRAGDPTSIGGDRVRSIYEDREGVVWVAVSGGGLNRFDRRTGQFKRYYPDAGDPRSLSHHLVWSVFEDSRGTLWVGTFGGGLNRFDRATETFTRFVHDPNDPSSLPSNVVLTIYEDRAGLLWFGTDNGVAIYNPAGERIAHFSHDAADASTLSHNHVLSVAPSVRYPNSFWVGTNRGGLNRLDHAAGRVVRVRARAPRGIDMSRLVVSSVAEDAGGTVWIGTLGNGLLAYDPASGAVTAYHNRPGDPASLSEDFIAAVYVDRDGQVWAATNVRGVNRLDRATGTFRRYGRSPGGLSNDGISTLFQDQAGRIWFATYESGLDRLDPATGRFTHFAYDQRDTTSLSSNQVTAFFEDAAGTVWVGTSAGLNRYDPRTGRFRRYTREDGLGSDAVVGIVGGEGGVLWLATNQGLSRLEPGSGRVLNYGLSDGLPTVRFETGAVAAGAGGVLVLGGPRGVAVLHPRIFQHKRYRPPLVITTVKAFGTTVGTDLGENQVVRLNHDDDYFSFEFALLDYTNPASHSFRYKLEKFDAEWQKVEGPLGVAQYRNQYARVGSFLFVVQGVDAKGRTSERRLLLVIPPPWWRTRLFRLACLGAALALTGAALGYGYRRKQQELAERVRMLTEGREQERSLLARELHDVPLQNLYSVRHRLEVIEREAAAGAPAELKAARSMLEQTAEELRRICGELRPPSLGPFGLSKAIRSHLRTFEEAHPDLVVDFDLAADGQRLPEATRVALFRIYQSGISNVARHAGARHAWIRFVLTDAEAVLEIEDDGRGFTVPKNWIEIARQQHYGLLGISEWADAIGGTLHVRAAPGAGALLQVRVPLHHAAPWHRFVPVPLERLGILLRRSLRYRLP